MQTPTSIHHVGPLAKLGSAQIIASTCPAAGIREQSQGVRSKVVLQRTGQRLQDIHGSRDVGSMHRTLSTCLHVDMDRQKQKRDADSS